MRFTPLSLLLALVVGLTACGSKPGNIVGPWKVVDLVLFPDSLNQSKMFDKSGYTKLRFTFNADSTMEISDGTRPGDKARYSLVDSGKEHYLILRPLIGEQPQTPGAVMETRLRIVQLSSDKLDLEQRYDQVKVTTRLEPIRN